MRTLIPVAIATALGAGLSAQADIVYSNISSTAGEYHDCITLWNGVANRPLAQESNPSNPRKGTDSTRKMRHRVVGGKNYLYWHDIIPDQILRATDSNGNGVLDPAEFETVYSYGTGSEGYLDEFGGIWWGCVGRGSATTSQPQNGIWKFQDLNNDGDFLDAGEANQMVAPPTITASGLTVTIGNPTACAILPNGDCIWYEKLSSVWFRTTPAGVHSLYLAFRTPATGTVTPVPPLNPDFGTVLPAIPADPLDRVAVDRSTGAVYLATNFSQTAGKNYVFRCVDLNNDGDINDAGEVTIFFDGVISTPMWGPIDDIDWMNGTLYVSYEIAPLTDPGSQFLALKDLNNDGDAMDAGELSNLGRTASTDDPTEIGICVVPVGTFQTSCVNTDIRNDKVITSTTTGTVTFTLGDIPLNQRNDSTVGYLLLSLTGSLGVPLPLPPFGCIVGITPDPLLSATIGMFSGGPFTLATQAIGSLPFPVGIPIGTKLFFAGMSIRTSDFTLRGVTQTGFFEVKS